MQNHTEPLANVSYLQCNCLKCPEGDSKHPGTDPGIQHEHCEEQPKSNCDGYRHQKEAPEDRRECVPVSSSQEFLWTKPTLEDANLSLAKRRGGPSWNLPRSAEMGLRTSGTDVCSC